MNFIQGDKFQSLNNNTTIFYVPTEYVNQFFLTANIENDFILISHNGDGKVFRGGNSFPHADLNLIPKNLKKWYAQNVCDLHEKLESIPIGLENSKWFPEIRKIEKMKLKVLQQKNIKKIGRAHV